MCQLSLEMLNHESRDGLEDGDRLEKARPRGLLADAAVLGVAGTEERGPRLRHALHAFRSMLLKAHARGRAPAQAEA